MPVITHQVVGTHRRVFRNLVTLWILFLGVAFLIALMTFPATRVNAMEPLPIPRIAREMAPPEFTQFSKVPPQGLAADRCQSFLKSVHSIAQDNRSYTATSNPTRRPAGSTDVQMARIEAIKSYRQCKSQSALQELAVWRWSR
jgi:hypothetical protein